MTTTGQRIAAADVFAIVDSMELAPLGELFTDDGSLYFGNMAALIGPEQIRAGVGGFYQTIGGLSHTILDEWTFGDDTIVRAEATYDRKDGRQVTIPVVSTWRHHPSGKLSDYRVYFDLTPVYA